MVKHDPKVVPQDEVDSEISVEDTSYEPAGLLNELLCRLQLRGATVCMEVFAIASMFQRLKYLL